MCLCWCSWVRASKKDYRQTQIQNKQSRKRDKKAKKKKKQRLASSLKRTRKSFWISERQKLRAKPQYPRTVQKTIRESGKSRRKNDTQPNNSHQADITKRQVKHQGSTKAFRHKCFVAHRWNIAAANMQIFIQCNNLRLLIYGLLFVSQYSHAGRVFGKCFAYTILSQFRLERTGSI